MEFKNIRGNIKKNSNNIIKLSNSYKKELLDTISDNMGQLINLENLLNKNDNNEIDKIEIENTIFKLEYLLFKLKANIKNKSNKKENNVNE